MQQWSQGCGRKLDLPLYVGGWGAPSCSAAPNVGRAGTCGLFPFISPMPFLALNFVTCSEVVQKNVALLAIVKPSVRVGGQGKLHNHHLITTDTQTAVQEGSSWSGEEGVRWYLWYSASCLDYFVSNKVWALIWVFGVAGVFIVSLWIPCSLFLMVELTEWLSFHFQKGQTLLEGFSLPIHSCFSNLEEQSTQDSAPISHIERLNFPASFRVTGETNIPVTAHAVLLQSQC